MKYIKMYTAEDNKTHFEEITITAESIQPLGKYSKKLPVSEMVFREFESNLFYDWHNAPQPQFIIYLVGKVEIIASGGEKKIFESGDVLFATDTVGKGHTTRTLTSGRAIIVTL